ncbi:MAG: tetratricopeptide repeat protein [Acidimicrobiia bacterium]|nr:tetratricopeptide repeat protein [Acidimicrobiia bacterium]
MIDPEATISALQERLASIPASLRPRDHGMLAYRLGLAYAESPSGQPQSNLRHALRSYAVAAALFDQRFEPVEHARVLNATAAANRALGRPAAAVVQFETAAELLAERDRDDERAAAFSNLGLTRTELGDTAAALEAFGRAVELFDAGTAEGRRGRAAALLNRGLAFAGEETPEALRAALADYAAADELVDEHDAPYHHALVAHSIGVACTALAGKDPSASEQLLDEATDAFRTALAVFTRSAFPFQHALAKHNLGRALLAQGGTAQLRRALACFEDASAVLDPRLHVDAWQRSHAGLLEAEAALASSVDDDGRARSFVALLCTCPPEERAALLRERLLRFLALPDPLRHAALAELAAASVGAADHGLAIIDAELTVLTELPTEHLEAALLARLAAHHRLKGACREQADRALDQAVGDALNGPQRIFVRDFLAAHGFERS